MVPSSFRIFLGTLLPAVSQMTLFVPGQGGQMPTRKIGFSGEYVVEFPQVFKGSSGKTTFDSGLPPKRQVLVIDLDK